MAYVPVSIMVQRERVCPAAGAGGRGLVPGVRQAAGAGRPHRGCTKSQLLGMTVAPASVSTHHQALVTWYSTAP